MINRVFTALRKIPFVLHNTEVTIMETFGVIPESRKLSTVEYLDQSAFDEKFEVNVQADSIRNIYHVENKYYVPVMAGKYREMYKYAAEFMMHPEDRDCHDLLNPDTLMERLAASGGMLKAECRQKLVDGCYRWVQYLAVCGEEHGVPGDFVYFYVFDIQNQRDRQNGRTPSQHWADTRNEVTGLLNSQSFFHAAEKLMTEQSGPWCCLAIDIQHFKVFNAWYGYKKGTYVLARIGGILRDFEQREPSVAAYFGRDNYCVLLRHDMALIRRLFDSIKELLFSYSNTVGFMPAFGICLPQESGTLDLATYDKARMAVEAAKTSFNDRIRYFDFEDYNRRKAEYALLTEFQDALKSREISFFLQPQCRISNGQIVGAEALARWIKPDGSVIVPGRFVPFLENNGFIPDLDKAVWEEVCRWLRDILDRGLEPVPISVNVSQVDLISMDVAAYLYGLTERYHIPARLLKIEITESAYAENFDTISSAVNRLKEQGFTVLMDDFGSGYSSLNMLDKVNTNVLKLDMAFMRKTTSMSNRGISIIESIINMTKTLNIPVIIEGVETDEQITFLKNMGCRYAQGYYFYRPMSPAQFEELLHDPANLDFTDIRNRVTELFHARELLDENAVTDTMLNNLLGPIAVYTQDREGNLDIVRFNQQFYDCIADVKMEDRQCAIQNYIVPEDHPHFLKMMSDACNDRVNGGECTVRFWKSGGGVYWYNMHLYFHQENEQYKVFYGKISDATKMYNQGVQLFEQLNAGAVRCMRIDLGAGLIYEPEADKPLLVRSDRCLPIEECLRRSAELHIPDPKEQERFIQFFNVQRLKDVLQTGALAETFHTDFILGGKLVPVRFVALNIRFMPNQQDTVYVFTYPEQK